MLLTSTYQPLAAFCPIVVAGPVTFDPAHAFNITFTNGNLTVKNTNAGAAFGNTRSTTSHSTGKYYAEFHVDADDLLSAMGVGVVNSSFAFSSHFVGVDNNSCAFYDNNNIFLNSAVTTYVSYSAGTTVNLAVDVGAKRIWWSINGNISWSGAGDPAAGTGGFDISAITGDLYLAAEVETSGEQFTANFGATAFSSTPPSGFGAW